MLHADVWEQLTNAGERFLCIQCMDERSLQRRGRIVTSNDLTLCLANEGWREGMMDLEAEPEALKEYEAELRQRRKVAAQRSR
jgi:hypothetical protein